MVSVEDDATQAAQLRSRRNYEKDHILSHIVHLFSKDEFCVAYELFVLKKQYFDWWFYEKTNEIMIVNWSITKQ